MGSARDRKLTQLMGEHLVAAALAERGWLPVVLPASWPDHDIMAQSGGGRVVRVQVKTMRARRSKIFAPRGHVPHPVVYVRLWGGGPEFFTVPGPDAERLRDESNRAYIASHPGSSRDPEVRMRTAMTSWAALEPYRGRWDLILDEGGTDE